MAIFRELSAAAGLDVTQDAALLDGLLRKDRSEVIAVLREAGVASGLAAMFRALLSLNGGPEVVDAARRELVGAPPGVLKAVDDLSALTAQIGRRVPGTDIHLDLAELRGYHYHTGLMFAAYTPTLGRALAWGGRYDNVGAAFGRPRPATGFSADMKLLAALSPRSRDEPTAVFAPAGHEPALLAEIARLRAAGHRVVQALPGQAGGAMEADCTQCLQQDGPHWRLAPL
jgi:ATP phosphoribosyltransferase regulatory subunit